MTKDYAHIKEQFRLISSDFLSIDNSVQERHFERRETIALYHQIQEPVNINTRNNVTFLLGNAGSGKSVVMRDLYEKLDGEDAFVLAIKSDYYAADNFDDLYKMLGTDLNLIDAITEITNDGEIVVLLIDQIDALSQALSSDRKALQTYLNFINRLSRKPNVRIVVSCRWYDYEYEPKLSAFRFSSKVDMGLLDDDAVSNVLNDMGIDIKSLSEYVKTFLKTPLHLRLFSTIADIGLLNENLTLQKMYDRFWKVKIEDDWKSQNYRDSQELLNCIDFICEFLFINQQLSMSKAAVPMEHKEGMNYLLSENVLNDTGKDNDKIQFIHQSLFDYAFARICYEKGKNFIQSLSRQHQGIFVRARVKRYFSYLREADSRKYIEYLRMIFNDKDENGKYIFRFHLQQMLLNTIGFNEKVLPEEERFVINDILPNDRYRAAFIESVYSVNWFKIVSKACGFENIAKDVSREQIKQIGNLLYRLQWTNHADFVIDYLQRNICKGNAEFDQMAMSIVDDARTGFEAYKGLYLQLSRYDTTLIMHKYLLNILSSDFDLVARAIKTNAKAYVETKENHLKEYGQDHEVSYLLKKVMECDSSKLLPLLLDLIEILARGTQMNYKASRRIDSWEFYNYDSGSITHDVQGQIVNKSIELISKMQYGESKDLLTRVSKSDLSVFVMIAAKVYAKDISKYHLDIVDFFCNSLAFERTNSICDYYVVGLLEKSFQQFTKEEQDRVVESIRRAEPAWENITMSDHQKFNRPIFLKGETKAQLLNVLPKNILKDHYPAEWEFLRQWNRKGMHPKNEKPIEFSSMVGYQGVDKYKEKADPEWISIMETVGKKPSLNYENPSMTGVGFQLSDLASQQTERFSQLLLTIIENGEIDISYKLAIFEGLQKGDMEISAMTDIFIKLVSLLSNDINTNPAGVLMSFTRCTEYFSKEEHIPEPVSNFLIKIATCYDDSAESKDTNETPEAFQTGINQVRGSAGSNLVKYGRKIQDKEALFKALECIASNGAVTTRAATLLELGMLIDLDKDRCLTLTLSLIGDNPSLMSLPVHNHNPLLYYTRTKFLDIEPFYEMAMEMPQSHDVLVCILWIAWANGETKTKTLCLEMLRRTVSCQPKLLNFIDQVRPTHINPECITDVYLPLLDSKDENTGKQLESILDNLEKYVGHSIAEGLIDAFVKSDASKFVSHSFIHTMEQYTESEPEKVLGWMRMVLKTTKDLATGDARYIDTSKFVDIVIRCYNQIGIYNDKQDNIEFAMNLIDDILMNEHMRRQLYNFFYTLDLQ